MNRSTKELLNKVADVQEFERQCEKQIMGVHGLLFFSFLLFLSQFTLRDVTVIICRKWREKWLDDIATLVKFPMESWSLNSKWSPLQPPSHSLSSNEGAIKDSLYAVFKGCSTNLIDFWWNKKKSFNKKIYEKKQKYGTGGDDKLKIFFAWP